MRIQWLIIGIISIEFNCWIGDSSGKLYADNLFFYTLTVGLFLPQVWKVCVAVDFNAKIKFTAILSTNIVNKTSGIIFAKSIGDFDFYAMTKTRYYSVKALY